MAVKLILQSNEEGMGHHRKEVIITNQGIAIATSQRPFIDLMSGRPNYDYQVMYVTEDEMDQMMMWWQKMRSGG